MGDTIDWVCRRCSCATLVESAATCCVSAAIDASLASDGAGGVRATDPDALDDGMLEAPEAFEPEAAALPGPGGDTAFAAADPGASADDPEGDLPSAGLPVGAALSEAGPSTTASLLCRAAMVASAAANRDSSAVYSALDTVSEAEPTEAFAPVTPAGAADAAAALDAEAGVPDAPALSRP